jgi:hypothetical protein
MAATVITAVLWDVTPYNQVDIYGRFGGTCCLHLLGRGVLSDSPLNINQCKRRHIPEYGNFYTVFF